MHGRWALTMYFLGGYRSAPAEHLSGSEGGPEGGGIWGGIGPPVAAPAVSVRSPVGYGSAQPVRTPLAPVWVGDADSDSGEEGMDELG